MRALALIVFVGSNFHLVIGQVSIGHRLGVSFSRWVVTGGVGTTAEDWNKDQGLVPGLSVELPVEIPIYRKGVLNTGLAFIQKGYQYQRGNSQQYRSNYLQIPLTVGWAFALHRFKLTPSVGGAYGLNVRGTGRLSYGNSDPYMTFPIGRADDRGYAYRMPDQEWSLLGRLGLSYTWGSSALSLDLTYQHGVSDAMFLMQFTDVNGNPVNYPYDLPKASQRSYVIQLGYQLSLGRPYKSSSPISTSNDTLELDREKHAMRPGLMVGTRFGAVASSMSFSSSVPEVQARVVDGAEPLIGITAAVMVKVRFSDQWSLRPELAYMQKGWRCQWYSRPTVENDLLRMTYLELPVLVSYQMKGRTLRPYFMAGPVVGRGLGGVHVYHATGGTFYGDFYTATSITYTEKSLPDDYLPWDFSAQAGIGLAMDVGRSALSIDVRYQHGFTNFLPEGLMDGYSGSSVASHRNWLLNIGYLVPWVH